MRRKILVALVIVFAARIAAACSCIAGGTLEGAVQGSDQVFAGVVELIADPAGDRLRAMSEAERRAVQMDPHRGFPEWGPEYGRRVTLRVMQWWKSDSPAESVEIWTGYGGGDCGYPLEKGRSYLVFARRSLQNRLTVSICSRTAALICGISDVEHLGEPLKRYETFSGDELIAREQPYSTYWMPCIRPALLIGERELTMNKHCSFGVDAVIGSDGTVSQFHLTQSPSERLPQLCPASLDLQLRQRISEWRFRPASIDGVPVAVRLNRISHLEPITEAEYEQFLEEQ